MYRSMSEALLAAEDPLPIAKPRLGDIWHKSTAGGAAQCAMTLRERSRRVGSGPGAI